MRKQACALIALSLLIIAVPVLAAGKSYSDAAFSAAQAAGKPILIHVKAPWCPTCKVQQPILESLFKMQKFAAYERFDIDFDTGTRARKKFGVDVQSTLIVFKGKKEIARSSGVIDTTAIGALLESGLTDTPPPHK